MTLVAANEASTASGATAAPAAEALITLRGIGLRYGDVTVLDGVDMSIGKGEFVCIVGPSGCGKTSLLRVAAGLVKPSSGSVVYEGKPLTEPRDDIAIVFQDYRHALLPWRNAAGNVSLALEVRRYPRAQRRPRIAALLDKVGLGKSAAKFPGQMSGGMQQRLQIARCLAQEPALMLMDEPFGALDAMTRQALQDEILVLAKATGMAVLFITHDLEEAIYLADRVICMAPHPGRIAAQVEIALQRPRDQLTTRESAEFLALRHRLFEFIGSH